MQLVAKIIMICRAPRWLMSCRISPPYLSCWVAMGADETRVPSCV